MNYTLEELCLEITNDCLLKCIHCSSNSPSPHFLDKSLILITLAQFEELGGTQLELSGGEPLLHPNLREILKYCENAPFSTTIYSSGIGRRSSLETIRKSSIERVIVSLYGDGEDTLEITGANCYRRTLDFIRSLKRDGINVEVHFPLMRPNYRSLPYVLKICEDLDVDKLKLLRLMPQGRARLNWKRLHIPERELRDFIRKLRSIPTSIEIELGNPLKPYLNQKMKCRAATSTCLIDSRGFMYPCPALKDYPLLSAGNVHEEPITYLWKCGFEAIRGFKEYTQSTECLAPWI